MPNIFDQIPKDLRQEFFEEILHGGVFKLERIVSKGQKTEEGKWYDQDRDEWVILLKGGAGILLDGEKVAIELKPGDHMHIPAHRKHRVEWTDTKAETVWIALHYQRDQAK